MNIIAVDNEQFALMDLKSVIQEAMGDIMLSCFDTPTAALEYAKNNRIDIAFLDIEMGGMNGIQLAKRLKDIYGMTNIIFVTGYTQYALDAFGLYASGYLLKPVTSVAINEAVKFLRHPVKTMGPKRLRVQTFGNFEVFVDGKPLVFNRTKTKELFAYLVIRQGAMCSNNEIAAVLWEDKEDSESLKSLFRNLVSDLTQALNNTGLQDIIIKQRGSIAINTNNISCDLYDFCAGIEVNSYMGEFMTQYSWAEFTNAYLDRMN
jgi:two-component SAPR family response regulator